MYITCSDELANTIVFEHLLCFVRVDGVKLFGAVSAGIDEDAVGATRVIFKEAGAVVDVTMDDDPSWVRGAMLFHFGHGEHFWGSVHEWRRYTLFKAWFQLLWFLQMLFLRHPPTRLVPWLGWVFKHYANLTLMGLAHICLHSKPTVVHHALHNIAYPKHTKKISTRGLYREIMIFLYYQCLNEDLDRINPSYSNNNVKRFHTLIQ